jgi:hypothetical protein
MTRTKDKDKAARATHLPGRATSQLEWARATRVDVVCSEPDGQSRAALVQAIELTERTLSELRARLASQADASSPSAMRADASLPMFFAPIDFVRACARVGGDLGASSAARLSSPPRRAGF